MFFKDINDTVFIGWFTYNGSDSGRVVYTIQKDRWRGLLAYVNTIEKFYILKFDDSFTFKTQDEDLID